MKLRSIFAKSAKAPDQSNARRVVFVPNRGYHVNALATAIPTLQKAGVNYGFCLVNHQQRVNSDAKAALDRLNEAPLSLESLRKTAGAGDVWVFSLDLSGQRRQLIRELRSRGVTTIGVQEGCRPSAGQLYRFVDEVLVWGVHAASRFENVSTIVGSPRLEKLQCKAKSPTKKKSKNVVVINYKAPVNANNFAAGWAASRAERWLDAVLSAVADCNLQPLISKHFRSAGVPEHVDIFEGSIEDALHQSSFLISRPSTTVYEAMVLGCQPFLFPFEEDPLCEFHDPHGAFPICWNAQRLACLLRDYKTGATSYQHSKFLNSVFDHRPTEPAGYRMAKAIMARLA